MKKFIFLALLLPLLALAQTVQFKSSNVLITGGQITGTTIGASTPAAGTFTTVTANNGVSNGVLTATTSAGFSYLNLKPGVTHYNWIFAVQDNINNGWEITPSTVVGGGTYTTPSISGNQAGAIFMPGLAASSAATTGTLCWTTGTGLVNVDTTVACLASTRKVKQDIEPLDIGLGAVLRMQPVSYDLKPEFNPEHLGRQVGLVAEDVALIDPRLVAVDDKGEPRGVRYMQLTAVLVRSIQELNLKLSIVEFSLATIQLFVIFMVLNLYKNRRK